MDPLPSRRIWRPSGQFLFVVLILVVATAIVLPGLWSSNRASNERNASSFLMTLTSAEADFRANDRDLNKVSEFWTGDVSGLYYGRPAGGGPEIRLLEESVANADANPLAAPPKGTIPKASFLVHALGRLDAVPGEKSVSRVDTDKSGRKVHHLRIFEFLAYPENESGGG